MVRPSHVAKKDDTDAKKFPGSAPPLIVAGAGQAPQDQWQPQVQRRAVRGSRSLRHGPNR